MSDIVIPAGARAVIDALGAAGHHAYIVGGCVRDSLLGLTPHDWDICTDATPEQTIAACSGYKIIETGLKHGTVTVVVNGEGYEVTTFRVDGDYSDHRRPNSVSFTSSLEADLARRDFTMNAIAMDADGRLHDPFGGAEDIRKQVIRCVGDPDHRFKEDGLRVLRALRFSATYGFTIDPDTAAALHRNRRNLCWIAPERIQQELVRLLTGSYVGPVLREFPDVLCVFWPDLGPLVNMTQNNPWHCYDGWEHTIHAVEAAPATPILRLAALLHDIGKPACKTTDDKGIDHFHGHPHESARLAADMLRSLRFDNKTQIRVVELVRLHDNDITCSDTSLRKWLNRVGEELLPMLIDLKIADNMAQNTQLQKVQERIGELRRAKARAPEVVAQQQCFSLKQLELKGDDLLAIGVPEGPQVGAILKKLLSEVIAGRLPNERAALLAQAKQVNSQQNRP